MHYKLKNLSPYQTLSLPLELGERLSQMSEDELKALLYIHCFCARKAIESFEDSEIFAELERYGYDQKNAKSALAYLRGAGLLEQHQAKKKAPQPQKAYYTSDQLSSAVDDSRDFASLREYTERKLGKLLNTQELATLYSFTDSMRFTPDVIMLVTEYCVGEEKTSLRYIERMLSDLANKQLTSYEAVEAHISNIKEYSSFEGRIKLLCGFGARALTKKEAAIISRWLNEKLSFERITEAYEQNVNAIKQPSLAYMDKILSSNTSDTASNDHKTDKASQKSFDAEDFFRAAVSKSRSK